MQKILRSKLLIFVIGLAIVLLLILLNYVGFLSKPKDFIYTSIAPLQKFGYRIAKTTTDYLSAIFLAKKMVNQNQWLEEQNIKLNVELSKLKGVEKENNILREYLNFKDKEKFESIFASIIGRDPSNLSGYLIVDKGKNNGIKVNYPVVTAKGVVIGKVVEVFESSAKIQLLTDPNSSINVITEDSNTTGVLRSENGNLVITMIPHNSQIKIGEKVLTSGLGNIFPRGLLVGEVEDIIVSDIDVFKKAKVRHFFDLKALEVVFILSR